MAIHCANSAYEPGSRRSTTCSACVTAAHTPWPAAIATVSAAVHTGAGGAGTPRTSGAATARQTTTAGTATSGRHRPNGTSTAATRPTIAAAPASTGPARHSRAPAHASPRAGPSVSTGRDATR